MKLITNKATLLKFIKLLKWGKVAAKLAAIGTTISGAVTAFTSSATTGVAISAAGATTYAATKGFNNPGYDRTKHIPPVRVDRTKVMLQQRAKELGVDHARKSYYVPGRLPSGKAPLVVPPLKTPAGNPLASRRPHK